MPADTRERPVTPKCTANFTLKEVKATKLFLLSVALLCYASIYIGWCLLNHSNRQTCYNVFACARPCILSDNVVCCWDVERCLSRDFICKRMLVTWNERNRALRISNLCSPVRKCFDHAGVPITRAGCIKAMCSSSRRRPLSTMLISEYPWWKVLLHSGLGSSFALSPCLSIPLQLGSTRTYSSSIFSQILHVRKVLIKLRCFG